MLLKPGEFAMMVKRAKRRFNLLIICYGNVRDKITMKIPTDEEYLIELYELYKDEKVINMLLSVPNNIQDQIINDILNTPSWKNNKYDKKEEILRESNQPKKFFNGLRIKLLKEDSESILEPCYKYLSSIPIGYLPTKYLNACAVKTPRSGVVILMNFGIILPLGLVIKFYISFWTWFSTKPYCRDHSQHEFARGIITLAKYCITYDDKYLRDALSLSCPSITPHDQLINNFWMVAEKWILFHEYGHAALNHLNTKNTQVRQITSRLRLNLFNKSQSQEFEADQFAYEQFKKNSTSEERFMNDLFPFGLLLNFFSLCEMLCKIYKEPNSKTHPPAIKRWERIKLLEDICKKRPSIASDIDNVFAAIYKIGGII